MRLQVMLALICALFPKAPALQCYQCLPDESGTCTDTQTSCPDQCTSKTYFTNYYGQELQASYKDCTEAEECITGSQNLGVIKTSLNMKCCSTDLCNGQTLPVLSRDPNGRRCYTCVGNDCTKTLNCEGIEDRCITVNETEGGTLVTMKGCTSKNLCTAGRSSIWRNKEHRSMGFSCCEGNLCNGDAGGNNSAAGVKLSLLIMLVPLLPFFFP